MLIECDLEIDLKAMIAKAVELQPSTKGDNAVELPAELYGFITDRLRRYFLDRDPELDTETLDAVMARQPSSLVDFEKRLLAVQAFLQLDEAQSLASANKRIANILRQAGATEPAGTKVKLLEDGAEADLYQALTSASESVRPLLNDRRYTEALRELASLRGPVDRFFDDVMVMVDNDAKKNNRLALLGELRALFLDVADILACRSPDDECCAPRQGPYNSRSRRCHQS